MGLIVFIYGDQFGLWLAGSLAVLTILHELGHALAARGTGAEAEIALDFLAGYASFTPSRPLTRWEQVGISFAGPAVQITVAVGVLIALGANPLDSDSWRASPATAAIWWAGVAIGLLNLIPVLPLDGGHIALTGLDRILPGRAERPMLYVSIAATLALGVLTFTTDRFRGFGLLVGFLLITQLQMLGSMRPPRSPWEVALSAAQSGNERKARRTLVAALSHPSATPGPPVKPMPAAQARQLVDLLPRPLPHGSPSNEFVLGNLLIQLGLFEEAAHYAAETYQRTPNSLSAGLVARAAAALDDRATAVGWLRTAAEANTTPAALASMIDYSPEFGGIRDMPEVIAIRRALDPSPAA